MSRLHNLAMVGAMFLLAAASGEYMKGGGASRPALASAPTVMAMPAPMQGLAETAGPAIPAAFGARPAQMTPASLSIPVEDAVASRPPLSCDPALALHALPGAMLSLSLAAPCAASARVLIDSNGLSFTALTGPDGRLALDLPAMANPARVTVDLPGANSVTAGAEVPDLAALQRIAVAWQGADRFALQALEFGAAFGSAGDVSAAAPRRPEAPAKASGGFLVVLGDATVDQPRLAEVYSIPRRLAKGDRVRLLLDAPVAKDTCGRQMQAQILTAGAAKGPVTGDVTLAMPACDPASFGEFVELPDIGQASALASR